MTANVLLCKKKSTGSAKSPRKEVVWQGSTVIYGVILCTKYGSKGAICNTRGIIEEL